MVSIRRELALVPLVAFISACSLLAQESPPQPPPLPQANSATLKLDYPDSPAGLEHLIKDIFKAQKENDGARADALLRSLILPEPRDWYDRVFGSDVADKVGVYYGRVTSSLAPSLARSFLNANQGDFTQIRALRYDRSCDDNAGEKTFGVLLRRREPVPLYELRFVKGEQFRLIFPLVYVEGSFRFILPPDFTPPKPVAEPDSASGEKDSTQRKIPTAPRIRVGGAVQAARLTKKVAPVYPTRAREEHLAGTVRLHAVIGKDGQVTQLSVVQGACSLAESAITAVKQWRYQPVLINGSPVEVDTEIDVIYSFRQ